MTPYTRDTLRTFLHRSAAAWPGILGWEDAPDQPYEQAIDDALLSLGVSEPDELTTPEQINGLRDVSRYYMWAQVHSYASSMHDWEADGGKYSQSQMMAGVGEKLRFYGASAQAYLGGGRRMGLKVIPRYQAAE